MKTVSNIFSSATLVLLGSFLIWFAASEIYWQLLNPQFRPFTMISGAACLLTGGAGALKIKRSGSGWTGSLSAMLFMIIAGIAISGFSFDDTSPGPPSLPEPTPRERINGREYVRITVPELLLGSQLDTPRIPEHFVLRGIVMRSSKLDDLNMVVVYRLAVVCCLADAVTTGVAVQVNEPDRYTEGQWIRVAGHLERTDSLPPNFGEDAAPGPYLFAVDQHHLIVPEYMKEDITPDVPYVFDIRTQEPYSY